MQQAIAEPKRKVILKKVPRNPALEQIRESVLSQSVNYKERASLLKEQIKHVHAAYLFSASGKSVLASICKVVTATPSSPYFTSWKDLGCNLGLSTLQIGCIEQAYRGDPTELVLKAYCQNWDSTLDQVVSALQAVDRYDAIAEAEDGLLELTRIARQEQIRRTEDINEGIFSVYGKGTSDGILRPDHLATLSLQLPVTLKAFPEKCVSSLFVQKIVPKIEARLQQASIAPPTKKEKKFSKAVLLTFAGDGEEIARSVAKELRKPRGNHLPIGVLLLEEHMDKVLENPEHFISHLFPQVHYVIPIITRGYLTAIDETTSSDDNSTSVDAQYATLIHDLMMKEYVRNGCRNKRFRCLIPDSDFHMIVTHKHMALDPALSVYEKVSNLEMLATRILKFKKKKSNRTL